MCYMDLCPRRCGRKELAWKDASYFWPFCNHSPWSRHSLLLQGSSLEYLKVVFDEAPQMAENTNCPGFDEQKHKVVIKVNYYLVLFPRPFWTMSHQPLSTQQYPHLQTRQLILAGEGRTGGHRPSNGEARTGLHLPVLSISMLACPLSASFWMLKSGEGCLGGHCIHGHLTSNKGSPPRASEGLARSPALGLHHTRGPRLIVAPKDRASSLSFTDPQRFEQRNATNTC